MTEMSSVLSGRYRLEEEIGRGGAGRVYRAHDERLDRAVAVKVLTDLGDTAVARFRREAATAARIRHPNVVTLHDAGVDGAPYLVMSLVDGRSLAERVDDDGPLSLDELHRLATDLFAGLDATHQAGVLHRDLTPRNVLFDEDGRALLADFGIARGADDPTLTAEHTIMGTRPFVAPERLRGEAASEATDTYAAGITLAYAITGRHGTEVPGTHPFAGLVAACTAEDPDERQGAREAARQVEAIARAASEPGVTEPLAATSLAVPSEVVAPVPADAATQHWSADGGDRASRRALVVIGLVLTMGLAGVIGSAAMRGDPGAPEAEATTPSEGTGDAGSVPDFDADAPGRSARDLATWLREYDD